MAEKKPESGWAEPEDDGIVRHYRREHRLSRASPDVRWLVGQYDAKRPGLFRSLTATQPLKFIFFTLLLFMVAAGLMSFFLNRQDSGTLGGNLFRASAFHFGDSVYITLSRTRKTEDASVGNGKCTALIDGREVASMNFIISSDEQEEYRFTAEGGGRGRRLSLMVEVNSQVLKLESPIR